VAVAAARVPGTGAQDVEAVDAAAQRQAADHDAVVVDVGDAAVAADGEVAGGRDLAGDRDRGQRQLQVDAAAGAAAADHDARAGDDDVAVVVAEHPAFAVDPDAEAAGVLRLGAAGDDDGA